MTQPSIRDYQLVIQSPNEVCIVSLKHPIDIINLWFKVPASCLVNPVKGYNLYIITFRENEESDL